MADQVAGQSEGAEAGKGAGSPTTELYKVVVSGEEHQVPMSELINGYQRQSDYTRKTQELSEREKRQQALVEERATELYLEALKKGDGKGDAGKGSAEGEAGSEEAKRLAALEQRIEASDKARISAEAERELNVHIENVAKKYPKADIDKVLISFYKGADEHTDVSKFFDEKASEMQKAAEAYDQKVIDSYVKRRTERAFGGTESGGSTVPPTDGVKPAKTFEEARERAEARLDAARGR